MEEKHADWQLLPNDINLLILKRLKFKTLLVCSAVCKRWNDFVKSIEPIWMPKVIKLLEEQSINTSIIVKIKKITNESYPVILIMLEQKFNVVNKIKLKLNTLNKNYKDPSFIHADFNIRISSFFHSGVLNAQPTFFYPSFPAFYARNNEDWQKINSFFSKKYYKGKLKNAEMDLQEYLKCHFSIIKKAS